MNKIFWISLIIILSATGLNELQAQPTYDWYISGGRIVDGTGNEAYNADVLIQADTIAFIGAVDPDTVRVKNHVDAKGRVVSPGFIDVHAHGNPLGTPEFRNFLAMGVTTILLGQDGSSPTDGSLAEWFADIREAGPALNIATLSGHGSLRSRAGAGNRPANPQELKRMQEILKSDLKAGSFGLSTGLEYVPGMYADKQELMQMAESVGHYNAILMSHMRSEDDSKVRQSIDELATLGKHAQVHISHLKVVYGEGKERADEILVYLDSLRNESVRISADTYPYAASYTGIGIVFPDWAKTEAQWQQALRERPELLRRYLLKKVEQRNGPGAILFGSGEYAGMTLKDIAEARDMHYADLLLEMGPKAASAAHFVMDVDLQDRIAVAPSVMISSDGSPGMRHPRGYGSFAKVIHRYVIEQKKLSIEEAVYKMSGLPAETLNIKNRGMIKKGYKADLIIFKPEEVRDQATFEQPHKPAEGIDWIWVNGKPARQEGVFNEERFGEVIRKEVTF
ncbi:MAG: N-acyl-D-amino-acid deacylase family protein [Candidatus Halalkalibacterium sp. M3_1C_030]